MNEILNLIRFLVISGWLSAFIAMLNFIYAYTVITDYDEEYDEEYDMISHARSNFLFNMININTPHL